MVSKNLHQVHHYFKRHRPLFLDHPHHHHQKRHLSLTKVLLKDISRYLQEYLALNRCHRIIVLQVHLFALVNFPYQNDLDDYLAALLQLQKAKGMCLKIQYHLLSASSLLHLLTTILTVIRLFISTPIIQLSLRLHQ